MNRPKYLGAYLLAVFLVLLITSIWTVRPESGQADFSFAVVLPFAVGLVFSRQRAFGKVGAETPGTLNLLLCPERRIAMKAKDGLVVGTGLLAILLGAMPLNGYFGFMRDPTSFYRGAFVGSLWHLLAGAVPFGVGILLLATSRVSTRQILVVVLCGVASGILLSLPTLITGNDDHAWLMWLSIVAAGCLLAMLIRAARTKRHGESVQLTLCPAVPEGRSGAQRS